MPAGPALELIICTSIECWTATTQAAGWLWLRVVLGFPGKTESVLQNYSVCIMFVRLDPGQ